MDGLTLLRDARAAGLTVMVDGTNLKIRGPKEAKVQALKLIANKAVVLEALIAELPDDWRDVWEERAGIMEFDGGLPRERAEVEALAAILEQLGQTGKTPSPRSPEPEGQP